MQKHKEKLVRDACHFMTYYKHGNQMDQCTAMLKNPQSKADKLSAFKDSALDMCGKCSTCTIVDDYVNIPAVTDTSKLKKGERKGIIDLSQLYVTVINNETKREMTNGETDFEIPDRKWLR